MPSWGLCEGRAVVVDERTCTRLEDSMQSRKTCCRICAWVRRNLAMGRRVLNGRHFQAAGTHNVSIGDLCTFRRAKIMEYDCRMYNTLFFPTSTALLAGNKSQKVDPYTKLQAFPTLLPLPQHQRQREIQLEPSHRMRIYESKTSC